MTISAKETPPYRPIKADLQYEDGEYFSHELNDVDISFHLLSAFANASEAENACRDGSIDDILTGRFEEDVTLEDKYGYQRPFSAYGFNLEEALRSALQGHPAADFPFLDMWNAWSSAAHAAGAMSSKIDDQIKQGIDTIATLLRTNDAIKSPAGLTAIFTMLLSEPGAIDAVKEALATGKVTDAVSTLRALAELPD